VLVAAKGAGGATAIESALASAIVQQQQAEVGMGQQGPAGFGGGATMELPMLPPAIALAVQNEFKTRFDGSEMQTEGEITRFAKSIASDFEHDARRASSLLSEATGGAGAAPPASLRDWRNTKKLAAVRTLAAAATQTLALPLAPILTLTLALARTLAPTLTLTLTLTLTRCACSRAAVASARGPWGCPARSCRRPPASRSPPPSTRSRRTTTPRTGAGS